MLDFGHILPVADRQPRDQWLYYAHPWARHASSNRCLGKIEANIFMCFVFKSEPELLGVRGDHEGITELSAHVRRNAPLPKGRLPGEPDGRTRPVPVLFSRGADQVSSVENAECRIVGGDRDGIPARLQVHDGIVAQPQVVADPLSVAAESHEHCFQIDERGMD